MSKKFYKIPSIFLVILFIASSTFSLTPQRVHAQLAVEVVADGGWVFDTISAVKNTITAINSVTSSAAEYALYIDKYVLEPLTFAMSGRLIQSITGGVINFINGQSNGTGQSQFVQNLQKHSQGVGDTQANAFFFQFGKNSNSPFASAITSSLRTNYLQQTSLAGFFVANQCTLSKYSQNQNAYLAGDWSQGGTAAWFALTTQDQNNPYILHARAQQELAMMVQDKTTARLQELAWGGGILSWCGGDAAKNADQLPPGTEGSTQQGPPDPNAPSTAQTPAEPGDPCTNSDGTPGTIQTPGTAIKGYLDKALGLNADKVAQMGNTSAQINNILGNIGKVLNTATFATQVIAGAGGLTGASLLGSGDASQAQIDRYNNSPEYFGITETKVKGGVSTSGTSSGEQLLDNAKKYEIAWNTIGTAANAAAANLTVLITACTAPTNVGTGSTAQYALTNDVSPVLAEATRAVTIVAEARAMVKRVQSGNATTRDLQELQAKRPTATDVANAEGEAESSDQSVVSKTNSLSVSEGTIVDRMNLLAKNALSLRNSCTVLSTP